MSPVAHAKTAFKADDFCVSFVARKLSAFLFIRIKRRIIMLLSIAIILISGLLLGWICKLIRFPSLFGMIIAGVIIGPHVLNLIDGSILSISSDIRRIALIIILIRAGLKLNLSDLKKVGRPAVLMCFVPACLEIIGMVLLAPRLLGVTLLDAAIMGAVVAAVSPAVIVPRMIRLIDEGRGTQKGIPQMIFAGASVDDVFVIVLFTTFTGMAQGKAASVMSFVNIPISILVGAAVGIIIGIVFALIFGKLKTDVIVMVIILLSISFALNAAEDTLSGIIPFAALIAIMCVGIGIKRKSDKLAVSLSDKFNSLWKIAEIFLFVLVGASVAIDSALGAGAMSVLLLFCVLIFRMLGVFLCLLFTKLNLKEKLFCMIAYTPKATVQAAIGGLPLAMGLPCGEIVLTVSVIAILVTAPLGAFGIDLSYKRFLEKNK